MASHFGGFGQRGEGARAVASAMIASLALTGFAATARADDTGAVPPPLAERIVNDGAAWVITKSEWSALDERGFSQFITALGRSGCDSLDACLKSPANPYRHTDRFGRYFADCADLPYFLRGYYAWKNGLPFSYQRMMRTADGAREDLRYSKAGNLVAARRDAIADDAGAMQAPQFLRRIGGEVSTAMFRTHPEKNASPKFDDFYPVKIDRAAITAGAIAYDIFGHVGVVYDIEADGRIRIMSSHPDHSLTRSVYGQNYVRAHPGLGAGLKRWRPIRLADARATADGALVGGRIIATPNYELPDFSMEQYFGAEPHPSGDWALGEFRHQGRTLRYHDYVRRVLADPDFAYDPVQEVRGAMRDICVSVKARKAAVDRAIAAGVHKRPHPQRLPRNIFGAYGDWEAYSTPSRDARLKTAFVEFRRLVQDLVERQQAGDPTVAYEGDDLAADMIAAYDAEAQACQITYTASSGERLGLNLHNIAYRLFEMSFDPYHCIERRWGAQGAELASCAEDEDKRSWHEALRFLRYQPSRTYDVRMDFARDELVSPELAAPDRGGLGWAKAPDVDVRGYLAGVQRQLEPLVAMERLRLASLSIELEGVICVITEADYSAGSKIGNPWADSRPSCIF